MTRMEPRLIAEAIERARQADQEIRDVFDRYDPTPPKTPAALKQAARIAR